ncbi:MAG: aldo/keto reductase [Polyangiaceae bacterium]
MQTRQLGPHGPLVGEIGLGCMYLSITDRPSEDDAVRSLEAALDAGVTFFDTANAYCLDDADMGHNERLLARALHGRKEKAIVGTKGGLRRPGGAWTRDARPAELRSACEASLKALAVEQIDLYQLHAPDPKVPFAESIGALAKLREEGKIHYVGLSNVSVAEIEIACAITPIASVQNRWNATDRTPETDGVLALCAKLGLAFLPYSPFGGARGARSLEKVGRLGAEAKKRAVSPHRLVLAWMLAKSPVVVAIPGARRIESIRDCMEAAQLKLSATDIEEIERSFRGAEAC